MCHSAVVGLVARSDIVIEYGYKWFNGIVLCNNHVDLYNNLTKRIELSHGTHKDFLINSRHKLLLECFAIAKTIYD